MKIALLFASKSGTTEKAATLLAEKLGDAECFDLGRKTPDLDPFDALIIGGPIRMGKLHKTVAGFIDDNRAAIRKKPYGLFICCGFTDQAVEELENVFDEDLRAGAVAVASFGGELDISKQKGPDKMIAKMALKSFPDMQPPTIDEDAITRFAEAFA